MKLMRVVECTLKVVCRSPKHKGISQIHLTIEVMATLAKSPQKDILAVLENIVKVNDTWYVASGAIRSGSEGRVWLSNPPIISTDNNPLGNLLTACSD